MRMTLLFSYNVTNTQNYKEDAFLILFLLRKDYLTFETTKAKVLIAATITHYESIFPTLLTTSDILLRCI